MSSNGSTSSIDLAFLISGSGTSSRSESPPEYTSVFLERSLSRSEEGREKNSISESTPLLGVRARDTAQRIGLGGLIKISILATIVVLALIASCMTEEASGKKVRVALTGREATYVDVERHGFGRSHPKLQIAATGPFLLDSPTNSSGAITIFALVRTFPDGSHELVDGMEPLRISTSPRVTSKEALREVKHEFPAVAFGENLMEVGKLQLQIQSEGRTGPTPIGVLVTPLKEFADFKLVMAAGVLIGLYVLIISEVCDRTLAAMLAASAAIACLALIGDRPTLERIVLWIDFETLNLLFGMMVMVAVIGDTGVFDLVSVLAFKYAKGDVWKSITTLCIFTAVISAFLDNVTVILLMTPVTIKLCKVLDLDPTQVLIALVMFSNIGGAATPVGDPPNAIIISNPSVAASGMNFLTFTVYLLPGVVAGGVGTYIFLRFNLRNDGSLRCRRPEQEDQPDELCGKTLSSSFSAEQDFEQKLKSLSDEYQIRDWPLLIKSSSVLSIVIALFFLQPILGLNLSPGWTALFGSMALLVLANKKDLGGIFERVEWATLLFFAALFVVMGALSDLGLLQFLGDQTEACILAVHEDYRSFAGVLFVIWVSALASSFIDNIPFTTVMVKIVGKLGEPGGPGLPLRPLVCALAFGACFGGNGTLIGASANVVCAGVAEQHGYRLGFKDFLRVGFPVMLVSTSMATIWMLIMIAI